MEIKKGIIFRGNINRVFFEILDANEKIVKYAVLLDNNRLSEKTHIFGRQAFEHCNLTRI